MDVLNQPEAVYLHSAQPGPPQVGSAKEGLGQRSGVGRGVAGRTAQQTRSLTTPGPSLAWICGFKLNQAAAYLCVSKNFFSTFD